MDDISERKLTKEEKRNIFIYLRRLCRDLHADVSTLGSAAEYLHRLLKRDLGRKVCGYTLATSCLIVAADVQEDRSFNKRDVINMSHAILHPDKGALAIDQPLFWEMRKTLIQIAHVIFRELKYKLKCDLICPYLCEYLAEIRKKVPKEFEEKQVADTAIAILADTYVDSKFFMAHNPKTIALVVLSLTLHLVQISLPECSNDEFPSELLNENLRPSKCERLRKYLFDSIYDVSNK